MTDLSKKPDANAPTIAVCDSCAKKYSWVISSECACDIEGCSGVVRTYDALLKEVEDFQNISVQNARTIIELEAEVATLRALIACTECSEELGSGDYHGWMAGICPGCQAEQLAPPEDQP